VNDDPPTSLALVGGGQGYLAQELTVDTTGTYVFAVTANGVGSGDWDSVPGNILGFLYQNSFVPSQPLSNVIENGGAPASSSWSHSLVAGTDYWIVVTGYCGTGSGPGSGAVAGCSGPSTLEEGPFQASLTGPGNITPLGQTGNVAPEPATFGMLIAPLLLITRLAYKLHFKR
jgi:hypothetical protein